MCGIAGIVSGTRLAPGDPDRARRMGAVLDHRGPDENGFHLDDRAALAHRRLSIVDSGDRPPAARQRGRQRHGRLQRRDLQPPATSARELEARGHRYRTRSDTETIVHAYEEWGDECVERFRGMFAFALWDAPRRRLLLVRDRLGIKPLYWARRGETDSLFASEIKAHPRERASCAARRTTDGATRAAARRGTSRARRRCSAGIREAAARATRSIFERGDVRIGQVPGTSRTAQQADAGFTASRAQRVRGRAVPRSARRVGPAAPDERRAARRCSSRAGSTAARSRR